VAWITTPYSEEDCRIRSGTRRSKTASMSLTAGTIKLPDGRSLDVFTGDPQPGGIGFITHHGTPGEGGRFADWYPAVAARGLRFVGFSRPGYVTSTRRSGRAVADVAQDVAALADALGINRFVSIGRSGGGPHSIACAALLGERCLAAAALVTVAPFGAPGLDWWTGMSQLNVDEFGAALRGEDALRDWMRGKGEELQQITGEDLAGALGDEMPAVDRHVLSGAHAEEAAAGIRRALSHGFDGWIDDDLAFTRSWGFDLQAIQRPVRIWQGELDHLVPVAHGRWLAGQIPDASFKLAEGHGHISLAEAHRDAILDDLLANAGLGTASDR
jgi:pimeloyl-ACP methyl ester carboxylesterase